MNHRTPFILLVSAPSGAGKTTVGEALLGHAPNLRRVTTCTTRAPRGAEVQGVDYHFLSADDFAARVGRGEFLEHATVYGRSYGTLKSSVLELLGEGRDVLLIIDVQGADLVRRAAQSDPILAQALVTVFLTPPTMSQLEQRLRGRGSDSEDSLRCRLESARSEAARWTEFDYLLLSDTRESDLARLRAIHDAEALRRNRQDFQLAG